MIESIILLLIIVVLAVKIVRRPKNFPPGPFNLPLIGNLPNLYYKDCQSGWECLRKRYGNLTGMVVPNFKLIVVSGWNSIKEVLSNEAFQGRNDVCLLRDRFDDAQRYGILFTDGEIWKANRRFVLHHFRNLGFGRKSHESIVLEEANCMADELFALNGAPVNLEPSFGISAVNIVWHLIGGQRFDRKDPKLNKLVADVKEFVHSSQIVGSPAVIFPFLRFIFPVSTGYQGIKNGSKGILQFIRESVANQKVNWSRGEHNNLIGLYLDKMANESSDSSLFTMGQMEGVCMDLLAAGSDTSSVLLSFAVLYLCLEPEMQEKIYGEIRENIGVNRHPCYEDKINLPLTEAFLYEVLRVRAPVPTFPPHVATEDSELEGYTILKDTVLILNVKSIYMDPEHWTEPEVFRPERFITEDRKFRKDERMISFGKGKRSCLGETLAQMNAFLTFVTLVERFSFRFPEGDSPRTTEGTPGFTIAPPDYRVIATPRNS